MTVAAFVQPLGKALLAFVLAAKRHAADILEPVAGSPAVVDRDAEVGLTEPMCETPVIHVDSLGSMAFHGALDHGRMYATALAHMDPPPMFADRSGLRPILEMDRDAMWLFEPGVTTEHRIRRSLRLDKRSAEQYGKAAKNLGPEGRSIVHDMGLRQGRIDQYARKRKWNLGDVKVPTVAEHVSAVTGSGADSLGGVALWHQTSGMLHGDSWALAAVLEETAPNPVTGQRIGGLAISGPRVAQSIAFAAASIHGAALARLAYYGIDPAGALTDAYGNFGRLWLLRQKDIERAEAEQRDG